VLTVVFDLTVAVEAGLLGACGFFIWRMGKLFDVTPYAATALPAEVQAFDLFGSLFFGAVGKIESLPAQIAPGTRTVVLDLHRLISLDTSGLEALEQLHGELLRRPARLLLVRVNPQPLGLIERSGFAAALGAGAIQPTLAEALGPPGDEPAP
jgi:SulP family sulfate permease